MRRRLGIIRYISVYDLKARANLSPLSIPLVAGEEGVINDRPPKISIVQFIHCPCHLC